MANSAYISTCEQIGCWHVPCPTVSHTPERLAHPLTALVRVQADHGPYMKAHIILKSHVNKFLPGLSPFLLLCPPLCFRRSCMLMHPRATPQGISTCSHFQALQTALLCGVSFPQNQQKLTQTLSRTHPN